MTDITDAVPAYEGDEAYPFTPETLERVEAFRRVIVREDMRQARIREQEILARSAMPPPSAPPTTATGASSSSSSTTPSQRKRTGTVSAGVKPGETKHQATAQDKGKGKARETQTRTQPTPTASSSASGSRPTTRAQAAAPPTPSRATTSRSSTIRFSAYDFTKEELQMKVLSCNLVRMSMQRE